MVEWRIHRRRSQDSRENSAAIQLTARAIGLEAEVRRALDTFVSAGHKIPQLPLSEEEATGLIELLESARNVGRIEGQVGLISALIEAEAPATLILKVVDIYDRKVIKETSFSDRVEK